MVVESERFVITYAAHTASCTFLLDAEGICRRIVMNPANKGRDSARSAARCVGAQYMASIDGAVVGCLLEMPRVGAALLFARVDARGRVSLVRTGAVIQFEARSAEDPFADVSVSTSAPEVAPARAAARAWRVTRPAEPDAYEGNDDTIRIRAAAQADAAGIEPDITLPPRTTAPSPQPCHATLRDLRAPLAGDGDPYRSPRPPSPQPRRSDPHAKAARSARQSSSRWATDSKAATRHRRER